MTEAAQLEGKELAPTSQVLCHWFDFEGQKSSLFYILGPLDVEAAKAAEEWPEDPAEPNAEEREKSAIFRAENAMVHFGKVEVDPLVLSKLYQDTRDLIDKMTASEALSAERNERDRKGYR